MRRGMMASLSGGLASMGAAVPYAIAAKFAHPDRPVIALVGDGAMQMNNMAELITVAKYWRRWSDPRWIVCVFNNEDLNQVTWEQRVMEGDPKFDASQQIPNVPYHKFAELIGLKGIYVDRPDAVGAAWDEALAADRPVVLEVKTDPEVPPLPPHITLEQAKHLTEALIKGDPHEGGVIMDTARASFSVDHARPQGLRARTDTGSARGDRAIWRRAAYRIPTDQPGSRRHVSRGIPRPWSWCMSRPAEDRLRLYLRGCVRRHADRRARSARCHRRPRCVRHCRRAGGDAARGAQSRAGGTCGDGNLRGRYRVVGSEGAAARPAAGPPARPVSRHVPIYGSGGFTTYSRR